MCWASDATASTTVVRAPVLAAQARNDPDRFDRPGTTGTRLARLESIWYDVGQPGASFAPGGTSSMSFLPL